MSSCFSLFCFPSGNCCIRHWLAAPLVPYGTRRLARQRAEFFRAELDVLRHIGQLSTRSHRREVVARSARHSRKTRICRHGPAPGRTAVKLLPWETTHLSAFAFSAEPGVSLERGQLIGLTIANVLIVVYFVVAACTGGRRSVHDYVAATEVCPSVAKRNR